MKTIRKSKKKKNVSYWECFCRKWAVILETNSSMIKRTLIDHIKSSVLKTESLFLWGSVSSQVLFGNICACPDCQLPWLGAGLSVT